MASKRVQSAYELYWSPTGQKIGTVTASTMKAAIRKAPKPYSRYKGEIYAVKLNPAYPRTSKRRKKSVLKRTGSALKKFMSRKNPGRKVKGGRAVSLRNFSGTVTRKSNGQVVIRGRSR